MQRKTLILILCSLLSCVSILGQCIDKYILWERLVFLRDSSSSPIKDQLSELLKYKSSISSCTYRSDSVVAMLFQRIGAAYYKLSDFPSAKKYINLSIKIINDSSGKSFINPGFLVRNYYILSLIYDSLNRPKESRIADDSSISVSKRIGIKDIYLLFSLIKKVEYLYNIGDYHQCINYAKEGELTVSDIICNKDSLQYLLQFITWNVNSLLFMNEFDEAEKLLENKINTLNKSAFTDFLGTLYERMAAVKIQKLQYNEAVYYFKKSLSYDKINKNYLSCMETKVNMGYSLYKNALHDNQNALRCYNEALHYASLLPKNFSPVDSNLAEVQLLNIYENIASIYAKNGMIDSAIYYFQKAFSQISVRLDNKNLYDDINKAISNNKNVVFIINTLLDAGETLIIKFKTSGNIASLYMAADIYTIADKLQFQNKNDQTDIRSQLFWRNNLRRLYENSIEISYLIGNKDAAFQFFEKSRAVLLDDQISEQKLLNNEDIFKLGRIKKKILQLVWKLKSSEATSVKNKVLQDELFKNNQELNTIEQSIKIKYPIYYHNILDTNSIHLKDIQNTILRDHAAMFELFNGDSAVYSLMITSNKCYLNKIAKIDFDKSASLYISYISDPALLNREYDQFLKTDAHLFNLIFQNNYIPEGRIIISPDGKYFPFEALMTNRNYSSPDYFLNAHAVSYTYSARFLLNDFAKNSVSPKGNFLGIAPVQYSSSFQLATLPQSDVSISKISNFFGESDNLINSRASKSNFLHLFPEYRIIQLYTHSSDSSENHEPVIYFADSALFLSELIPENKTATQLIVLSACETGNGKDYKGEGVFSFNRGFAALGIPSSIINLWSVDNESTYKLTELFYKYASTGLPLDVSLQKAKLEFIATSSKEKRLPYYWAAAILAGKTDAVEIEKSNLLLKVIISAIVILGLLLVLVYNKYKLIDPDRIQSLGAAGL